MKLPDRPERKRPAGPGLAATEAAELETLMNAALERAVKWMQASARGDNPVLPAVDSAALVAALSEPLPVAGSSPAALMSLLDRTLFTALRDSGHARFFGYVNSAASAAGVAGDLLASALDQNLTSWRSAPGAVELERLVLDWLRQVAGLPQGAGGVLTSGGSAANLTALAVARHHHTPEAVRTGGLAALEGRSLLAYASEEVHMSVPRALELLGLGRDALRRLPADSRMRLRPADVAAAVRADRAAGHLPFAVIGSAGTVGTGALDPLEDLAATAGQLGLWFHVDAAYGGFLRLAPAFREKLAGLSVADSVALDPHKWLSAPLDVGAVLYRDPALARAAFATRDDYADVFEAGPRENFVFFDHGLELSRRLRGLKVWMILKLHGSEAMGRRIQQEVELARRLANRLQNHDETELLAPVETSIVAFRYVPTGLRFDGRDPSQRTTVINDLNRALMLAIQKGGRSYLSNTTVGGAFALRACVLNFRTGHADVDALADEVLERGRSLSRDMGLT